MRLTSFALGLAGRTGLLSTAILMLGAGSASAASLFENYLERGYSEVAVYARTKAQNSGASSHFARKAAAAASGRIVAPDSPADTGRPVAYLAEQYDAHTRLMEALAAGAAEDNARMAAVAQINYDCWLAELSAGPGEPDSSACRLLFYTALDQIVVEPEADDFITLAGPANAAGAGDDTSGGNDNPDRLPPPAPTVAMADGAPVASSRQLDAGPISALSPLAAGEYATATWIYPAPMAMPSTPAPGAGATSEHAAGVDAQDGDDESAGSGVTGALGGAVDHTSDALGGTVSDVGGAVGGTVGGASAAVGGTISGVGNAVGGPVGDVAGAAGDTVSGLGGAAGGAVSGVADAAGGAISGLGGAVGGALGGLGKEQK